MISKKIIKILNKQVIKEPFDHLVIDNFLQKETLIKVQKEFPQYRDNVWHEYSNYCEYKKTCNQWNHFKPAIYNLFTFLNSEKFLNILNKTFKQKYTPIMVCMEED